ncbi:MAG TPA: carboxypeptidase-like regulatory domain-containing protein, partial [Pyrinomonadaceae bacterium]
MLTHTQESCTRKTGRAVAALAVALPLAFTVAFAVAFACARGAAAQTTSTVEGTVADANGAPVAGARVTLENLSLATSRSALTDGAGFFRVPALEAGSYALTAGREGFAPRKIEVRLPLNQTLAVNLVLDVRPLAVSQVVTADGGARDPASSAAGTTVEAAQLRGLPLNGRNYLDLLQLAPGVASNRQADSGGDA